MLERIISFIFRKRHYWRRVSFDEIAELYVSRLVMMFALNMLSLFVAIYLYELGYSVPFIAFLYAGLYLFKAMLAPLFAKYVAHFGPKHAILAANILRIPSMVAIFFVPQVGIAAVLAFGLFQQASSGLYYVGYWVDFSKIRHAQHTGKEMGTIMIVEKIAKVVAPILGGIVASVWGPQLVIVVSACLFVGSSFPLFRTAEPIRLRSKLTLAGFPWRLTFRSMIAQTGAGFDFVASGIGWTLFLATVLFASSGNELYATVGALASFGVLAAMLTSWLFGKIVDERRGDTLFVAGVVGQAIVHAFRPFMGSPASVAGLNIANETTTAATTLPWMRAVFDIADSSGFRIVYLTFLNIADDLGAALACIILGGLVWFFGLILGLQLFFVVAAFYMFIMIAGRRYTH